MEFEKRCWAEIDLDRLEENFRVIRSRAPKSRIMAVVKADAYGHGDAVVASMLENAGADQFAVSGFAEAMRLRRYGVSRPVLVLGYTNPQRAAMLAANSVAQSVYSLEYAKQLSFWAVKEGVTVSVHLKLDTGMGRIGFGVVDDMSAALEEIRLVHNLPGLSVQGVFTHFAVSDSAAADDVCYTHRQFELFMTTTKKMEEMRISIPLRHCCNSGGIFAYPEMQLDMVRAGIILYGCAPSGDVPCPGLAPALSIKAVISLVKEVKPGDDISYGRLFHTQQPMRLATVTIGYADGYQRALSNCGVVSIHGQKAKVVGRVCMDQMMVDVTHIENVKLGDIATVFGGDGADTLDEVAQKCSTINYEILCDIGRRVPRVYLRNGEPFRVTNYLGEF